MGWLVVAMEDAGVDWLAVTYGRGCSSYLGGRSNVERRESIGFVVASD